MTNYMELLKQLEKKDEHIITKLAIYNELFSLTFMEDLTQEDTNDIVEYVHSFYLSNDDTGYLYPKLARATLEACNYDLQKLLASIREKSKDLGEQILNKLVLL